MATFQGAGGAKPEAPVSKQETLNPGPAALDGQYEAEYSLEHPVRCQACGEIVTNLKAIRLLRTEVNFTSTLPRRGRVVVCPLCHTLVSAELSNF